MTFLAASYRAVLDKAYIKGFASSFALLAVASPYAVAADSINWSTDPDTEEDISVDGTYTGPSVIPGKPIYTNNLEIGADNATLKFNNITVKGNLTAAEGTLNFYTSGTLTVQGNLSVAGKAFFDLNEAYIQQDILVEGGGDLTEAKNFTLTFENDPSINDKQTNDIYVGGNITVNGATLKVTGNDKYHTQVLGKKAEGLPISSQLNATCSIVEVNKGSLNVDGGKLQDSVVNVGGLVPHGGESARPDTYVNYSNLYMGMGAATGGTGGENSKATISNTTLNIGNQGLFGAASELVLDQNSQVNFTGNIDNNPDRSKGEIAAKAILRAKTATLDSNAAITVNKNTNGALHVQNFTLNNSGSSINVQADGQLYISGRNSFSEQSGTTSNTFEDGAKFNFNAGSINNSGTVTLGAVSSSNENGTLGLKLSKFMFTQNNGTFNNNGTLQIGEALSDTELTQLSGNVTVQPYDIAPGTTFLGKSGTFVNAKDAQINVNKGSSLQLQGTSLDNQGQINVLSGAELSVTASSKLTNTSGSINIADGANVTIRIDALDSYKRHNNNAGLEIDTADISSLGNFKNSGTITLDNLEDIDAVYNLKTTELKEVLGANLNKDNTQNETRIKLSDNTHLRFGEDLDLSANSLKQFSGGADSSLQTTGTLSYTTAETSGYDDLKGLALVGKNLIFEAGSAKPRNSGSVTIFGQSNAPAVFVATESVSTANPETSTSNEFKPLVFQNAELHLDADALAFATPSEEPTPTPEGSGTKTLANADSAKSVYVNMTFNEGSKLVVDDSLWTVQNIELHSNSASMEINGSLYANNTTTPQALNGDTPSQGLIADKITLYSGASVKVNAGVLIAERILDGDGGSLIATGGSQVIIKGDQNKDKDTDKDTNTVDFYGGTDTIFINSSLDLGDVTDTIGLTFNNAEGAQNSSGTFTTGIAFHKFKGDAVDIYLELNSGSGGLPDSLTTAQINDLFDKLVIDGGTGLLHIDGNIATDISGIITSGSNGQQFVDFDKLNPSNPDGDLTMNYDTEQTRNIIVTNIDGKLTGGWKAAQTSGSGPLQITTSGTLALYGTTEHGNIVEDSSGTVTGVKLNAGSTLMLKANGKIGSIDGTSGTLALNNTAHVTVTDASGKDADVSVNKLLSAGYMKAGTVNAAQIEMTTGSALDAQTVNVTENFSATGLNMQANNVTVGSADFNGSQLKINQHFTAQDSLNFDSGSNIKIDGTLTAAKGLRLIGDSILNVNKLVAQSGDILVGAESGATIDSSSASLIANHIDLGGNNLILDPEFGQKTATVFAKNIGAQVSSADESGVYSSDMSLNGNIIVGRNSALGLGNDQKDFEQALADKQVNGSLTANNAGAFLYVDRGNIYLNENKLIVSAEDVETLKDKLSQTASIYLGESSMMQVTSTAMSEVSSGTAVFAGLDASKSISSKGGKLLLPAGTKSSDLAKLFGTEVVLETGSSIEVTTENGLFTGTINDSDDLHGTGDFEYNPSEESRQILSTLSEPTYNFVMNVLSEETTHYASLEDYQNGNSDSSSGEEPPAADGEGSENEQSKALATSNGISVIDNSVGYNFLREAASSHGSRALEHSARMATLGGVMQVAMQVGSTTTDAISGRVGAGQSNGQTLLAGGQLGRVWATPVYKNFSSDGFSAHGLNYGPEIDLYGAAMGVESTIASGITTGLLFNIGSGDAKGSGVASGINNDFSYYGFGLYTSIDMAKNFNVAADVSYTLIDNNLDAGVSVPDYNKLEAATDSNILSMGISAQYLYKTHSSMMIMPHIGLRYDHIKFDGYKTKIDGSHLAQTSGASANVFSIPLGVSFYKDIRSGNWLYRPSADFNLTANFGDNSVNNTTNYDGIYGANMTHNTEFIDPLVYSASFGFTASTRTFSIGASVGYAGSSNTDEFSVGLNGRWRF